MVSDKRYCCRKGSPEGVCSSVEDCKKSSCSGPAVGEKEIRRKAQHRRREEICVQDSKADGKGKDMVGVNCPKEESGNIVVKPEMIKKRWREYMEQLLNAENDWGGIVE